MENLESHGVVEYNFPGLESHGICIWVKESRGILYDQKGTNPIQTR